MVTAATSFGRSGLSDWIIQRFSALILGAYAVFIVGFLVCSGGVDYLTWQSLFAKLWMKIFSLSVLLSVVAHGWIGLWVVLTDYVTERMMGSSALVLRLIILTVYALMNVAFIVWGIDILWGH